MTDFITKALAIASNGFSVFPLVPNTRDPALKEWPTRASSNPEQIKFWWSQNNWYAKCNIGVACQSDYVVIDVDVKNGKLGMTSLDQLIKQGLPQTYTVKTPSGGIHLYYKRSPDIHIKSVVNHWPGIDIRGNGGFAVAPGSIIDKIEYTVLCDIAPVYFPDTIRLPLATDNTKERSTDSSDSLIVDASSPYSELPDVVKLGERDDYLFRSACSWRERGYTKDHAAVLMQALHARCEQRMGDEYPLDAALQKLEQAWSNYKPSQVWSQVITPAGPVLAPSAQINTMKEALDRFIFIVEGNRVADTAKSPQYAVMKIDEFKNAYRNSYIGTTTLPTAWLGSRGRQTVRGTTYWPQSQKIIERNTEAFYNVYSSSGNEMPSVIDKEKVKPFLEHILYVLGDKAFAHRFLMWCAVSIQLPQERIPWMPLIITRPRCGKGVIFSMLQAVVGEHNTAKVPGDELKDLKYNSWLSKTLFACIEELKTTRRWDVTERLKELITERFIEINTKFGSKGNERVFTNLIAFSNHADAASVMEDDSRLWVVHNKACQRNSSDYYRRLYQWVDDGGPAHLEAFLKSVDISQFDWTEPPPMTDAKREMIDVSKSLIERQIRDAIDDREGPFRADIIDINLVEDYLQANTNYKLSEKDRYLIIFILGTLSTELPKIKYRVRLNKNVPPKRYRCRAIRNVDHWMRADNEAIEKEFIRAWMFANGQTPQTEMKEVKQSD